MTNLKKQTITTLSLKVAINIPIFKDTNTPSPFVEVQIVQQYKYELSQIQIKILKIEILAKSNEDPYL